MLIASRKLVIVLVVILATLALVTLAVRVSKTQVSLVPGFPETPVYQNARLLESVKDPREAILFEATWETDSSVPSVSNWYLESLQREGWTLDVAPADASSDIQLARLYKDNYTLHLSIIFDRVSAKTKIVVEFLKNLKLQEVKNPDPEGFIPKIP